MLLFGYDGERALSPKEYARSSHAGNFSGGALRLHCAPFVERR
jgi:hypothetical protein